MTGKTRLKRRKSIFFERLKRHPKTFITLFLIVILLRVPYIWYDNMLYPVGPHDKPPKLFIVESGSNAKKLSRELHESGLIKSPLAFNLYTKLNGHDVKIKAGNYMLSPQMSTPEIVEAMVFGYTIDEDIRITIPEGTVLERIGEIFEEAQLVSKEEFLRTAKADNFKDQYEFLKGIPRGHDLEGTLFPDTYFLPLGKSPEFYIRVLLNRFKEVFPDDGDLMEKLKITDFDIHEAVVMASLIEAEAMLDSEKPIISGVFHNRLRLKKPLESCATVEYVLKERKEILSTEDTQIDSPYNTYKYSGLPPGPIGAPGLKAIEAAINPQEVDFLYFVSNGDGSHTFNKNYSDHVEATKRIQRGGKTSL